MNIKLIIFDFDGTIMDTKNTIIAAKQETLRQMGVDVADEQTCASTIGMSAKIGFQKLCPEFIYCFLQTFQLFLLIDNILFCTGNNLIRFDIRFF